MTPYEQVRHYLDTGKAHEAGGVIHELMQRNPDDPTALRFFVEFLVDGERAALAHPVASWLAHRHNDWLYLGAVENALQRPAQARKALKKALAAKPTAQGYGIMALACVADYDIKAAEKYAKMALDIEDRHEAHTALAWSALQQRQWKRGWKEYRHQLGRAQYRVLHDFGLPEWQGEDGKVLVYAEQGLGDQIAYLSAIQDIGPHQITCHPRLKTIFSRVFPEVHGDQFTSELAWQPTADYQCSMATAMQYVETKPRPGYLRPNPILRSQIDHSLPDGPRVGIAWTGGITSSANWRNRNIALEDFRPLMQDGVTYVSLEYRDQSEEIDAFNSKGGHQVYNAYDWVSREDLDYKLSLVSCLDAVVCVPTTAYHLAGALSIPAYVIVHEKPHWHEGMEGDSPWWESVKLIRRTKHRVPQAMEIIRESLPIRASA